MSPTLERQRRLVIDVEKCCGCFACAAACHEKFIQFEDEGPVRLYSAPRTCGALCDACQRACPVNAIDLQLENGTDERLTTSKLTWSVALIPCRKCGQMYTTEKLRRLLVEKLQATFESLGQPPDWIPLCPRCRRDEEAYRLRAATRTFQSF
ncbi:4Fe-4S dicluster domain-containing protein [Desulfosoma caldarium]|uniref:4Fe-4S ferredoxin-type domain-containing protein n=1 Tax=Desulfosoma caldarium TaxID=610254 RepID=A0A3N1UKQ8_9BACT|nr:4Fe-4S dicluster domain-containing protein [Desulfosoma caldarium]ROQ90713.1 hypothetical protein EDC27_2603 [Desulfosoma caldarium]